MLLFNMTQAMLRSLGLLFGFCSKCVLFINLMKPSMLMAFQVSVLDINQYAVIVEGVEKVANVVARYRIIEKLYLMKQHEATTQLEEHIADLYTLVLKFLVKAKEFYRRNTASQYRIHPFECD